MNILVSACLVGENCKYNGGNNYCPKVAELAKEHNLIAVCPEVLGGLPIPRKPAEIRDGKVVTADEISVDREFREGAAKALGIALENHADLAILQPRSPSCGCGQIYDGSFSKRLVPGMGVFAKLLTENGVKVLRCEEDP